MKRNNTILAVVLAQVTLIFAWLMPLFAVLVWLFWDSFAFAIAGNLTFKYNIFELSAGAKLQGFCISVCGALVHTYGLLGLRQTFLAAKDNAPFSDVSLKGFKRFAWVTLLLVPVGILQHTLLVLLFSVNDSTQLGALEVNLGSNEVKALFIGVLLVFVAHVFKLGKAANDENETFL